jgi:hypothetical protein
VRPATPLICAFIDEHKERYGVVPICRALGIQGVAIAPRTYRAYRSSAPSKRALWDNHSDRNPGRLLTNPMPTGNARRNAYTAA